jgi:hypothetical protein
MLFLGSRSDLAYELLKAGYGTKKSGFIKVIDTDADSIEALRQQVVEEGNKNKELVVSRISFQHISSYADMKDVCKQSSYDSIVDYGGLDSILDLPETVAGDETFLKCIDHLQNALRLGNVMVSLSHRPEQKDRFCDLFSKRFGWIQELDGDPGEISQWYRGKTNIAASQSNFQKLGLKMFVYTNADNC